MTIAQVLYVLEIADCRSISAAAERQFISQSALSQQIQRLEGELGYPLFVRTPRGLTLTAAGETFCREARPVAEQWQRLCSAVKPDGRRGRRLRIGMGSQYKMFHVKHLNTCSLFSNRFNFTINSI